MKALKRQDGLIGFTSGKSILPFLFSVPDTNRTCGLSLRRRTLYPTELREHYSFKNITLYFSICQHEYFEFVPLSAKAASIAGDRGMTAYFCIDIIYIYENIFLISLKNITNTFALPISSDTTASTCPISSSFTNILMVPTLSPCFRGAFTLSE